MEDEEQTGKKGKSKNKNKEKASYLATIQMGYWASLFFYSPTLQGYIFYLLGKYLIPPLWSRRALMPRKENKWIGGEDGLECDVCVDGAQLDKYFR